MEYSIYTRWHRTNIPIFLSTLINSLTQSLEGISNRGDDFVISPSFCLGNKTLPGQITMQCKLMMISLHRVCWVVSVKTIIFVYASACLAFDFLGPKNAFNFFVFGSSVQNS
jgi:hypothetical protein